MVTITLIHELRRARQQGELSSVLFRKCIPYLEKRYSMISMFGRAFNLPPSDMLTPERWTYRKNFLDEITDRKINSYLELRFSRLRLGGHLVPSNVTSFLDISMESLNEIISKLNTEGRFTEVNYADPKHPTIPLQDIEMEADLLWEIESIIKPENVSPWWWWEPPTKDRAQPWLREVTKIYD